MSVFSQLKKMQFLRRNHRFRKGTMKPTCLDSDLTKVLLHPLEGLIFQVFDVEVQAAFDQTSVVF
jgi:hypothetical protein